ncbi:MAG: NAD kinase [Bacteroidales bacterium]|nr:NAD kinase [Bacteroidales bacterium]MCF8454413.1 NAD kinase [Bacteroidales bacterium]
MKIAIYGRNYSPSFHSYIESLFQILRSHEIEIMIYEPFWKFINKSTKKIDFPGTILFNQPHEIIGPVDFFISIGGDGTFLETIPFVKNLGIPIVGINSGRMGFLADIAKEELSSALENIIQKKFKIEERVVISLETPNKMFGENNFALNELTIHKKDSASMITIHAYINDEYLNSYWADGIIISTPTGSTAYSLSVGGPIVLPHSENFIITPIAPHNLTVRPIVIPDKHEIRFEVEGRSKSFLASLDHRSESFDSSLKLIVRRANFTVKIIKLENQSFFSTLRNKLMWGLDKRN